MDSLDRIRRQVGEYVEEGHRVAEQGYEVWANRDDADHAKFSFAYQDWYRKCLGLLEVNGSSALREFTKLYDSDVGVWTKLIPSNYGMSDTAVKLRMNIAAQVAMLAALPSELSGRAMDIQSELSYQYIADEYDQALVLSELGFERAAGAVAGVALERNLHLLAQKHDVDVAPNPPTKKRADFSDYLAALKKKGVINELQRKQYEALYEVRKQCSHPEEPKREDIERLIHDGKLLAATAQ
jgi:hypothetical protein